MKSRALSSLAVAVVVAGAVACAPQPQVAPTPAGPTPGQMVAAANALDQAFVDAFNKGDADALAALYWNSPEVASFPPDTLELRGLEAIREGNRKSMAAGSGVKLELTEVHQIPSGDIVVGWGKWKVTVPVPEGAPIEVVGRFTDVKAERDGKWVYLLDHASVPTAPSPAPAP